MRAWLNLRYTNDRRAKLFEKGLKRVGYKPDHGITQNPGSKDILITWNRIGQGNTTAKEFKRAGLPVLVVENATWGNTFADSNWYHIARNYHNTSGMFDVGDNQRWDSLGIFLDEWRQHGETVILPQRGIGSAPVAMPRSFAKQAVRNHGGRVRPHPGVRQCKLLEDDLAGCGKVITWGSGAAVKALMMGIKVESYMPNWIAEQDNTDEGRLQMLRRLAWAQWTHEEISSGDSFDRLLP